MTNLSRSRENYQQFPLTSLPETRRTNSQAATDDWTPQRELLSWLLRRKLRAMVAEARLVLRVSVAVVLGDRRRCNLALDAVILHEEGEIRPC